MAGFAKYYGVDGESLDADHRGWVDLLAFDWAVGADESSSGATRRRGSADIEDFNIVLAYEKAAVKLQEGLLRGKLFPRVEVELTATYGGARTTYLRYEMKNVTVTSYQVNASGSEEDGPPIVAVANRFEEIKVTYTEYDPTGNALGSVESEYKEERAR
jgi:type VI secretion system Hcp family effector